jgi:hypothetical protein
MPLSRTARPWPKTVALASAPNMANIFASLVQSAQSAFVDMPGNVAVMQTTLMSFEAPLE